MTIRFDAALVIGAVALLLFGHPIGAVLCLCVLWIHKHG